MFINDTIIFHDRSQLVESGDLVLFRDSIQSAGGGASRLKDGIKTAGKNGEVKTWHKNHDSLSKMKVYLALQAKKKPDELTKMIMEGLHCLISFDFEDFTWVRVLDCWGRCEKLMFNDCRKASTGLRGAAPP